MIGVFLLPLGEDCNLSPVHCKISVHGPEAQLSIRLSVVRMEVTKVKRPTMNVGQDEPASVVCGLLALKIEIP